MSIANYNGSIVEVVARKGGWTTIITDDGSTKKVRNGQLKASKKKVAKKKATAKTERDLPKGWHRIGRTEFDLSKYESFKNVRTASGRPSIDVNDQVASKLRGKTLDEVYEVAAKVLDLGEGELRNKYDHLNPGMQRMNLGNRMRKVLKDANAS